MLPTRRDVVSILKNNNIIMKGFKNWKKYIMFKKKKRGIAKE